MVNRRVFEGLLFRSLERTLGVALRDCRLLAECHERIETFDYDEAEAELVDEVLMATDALLTKVCALPQPK